MSLMRTNRTNMSLVINRNDAKRLKTEHAIVIRQSQLNQSVNQIILPLNLTQFSQQRSTQNGDQRTRGHERRNDDKDSPIRLQNPARSPTAVALQSSNGLWPNYFYLQYSPVGSGQVQGRKVDREKSRYHNWACQCVLVLTVERYLPILLYYIRQ